MGTPTRRGPETEKRALDLGVVGGELVVAERQSTATPSVERRRKSSGRRRTATAVKWTVVPPTARPVLTRPVLSGSSPSTILRSSVLSSTDLAAPNANLVGGDIYSGALTLDQNFLWRPRGQLPGHRTPIRQLYHIGASMNPDPGLGGGSGTMVAKQLLRRHAISRLAGLARR
jgi:phytoene dehydrogenase-like protein